MNSVDRLSHTNTFEQNLEILKEYTEGLLRLKMEKTKDKVKDKVDDILENRKPSLFDNFKKLLQTDVMDLFWNSAENQSLDSYESHREDRNDYIPYDLEFWEAIWESSRFAEIYPGFRGYFISWKKSYFDRSSNLWSKKKKLSDLNLKPDTTKKSYTYAGIIVSWTISIPLPDWSLPDIESLHFNWKNVPIFQIDQNNCIYITSSENQYVSFKFYTNQKLPVIEPISEDSEKIIFDKLTKETRNLLDSFGWNSWIDSAGKIRDYIIKTKKYSAHLQWTLRNKTNSKNYITNLDKSEELECFSANSLFVALCREIWLKARLIVWNIVQTLDKNWKSLLSSNNWHAWSEVWNGQNKKWIRFDATPTQKENWNDIEQNMDNWENEKTPAEMIKELLQQARDDNIAKEWEKLKETIEKLEKASSKEEIRILLDNSWLSTFTKVAINKIWNEEIIRQERGQIQKLDDEKEIDKAVKNSLLDDEFKDKLRDYARELKKKIQEERKRMYDEMQRMGFREEELQLYKLYKTLEKELMPEVKKQIRALVKILPHKFKIINNENEYFTSGSGIGSMGKLVEYELIHDAKIFTRNQEIRESSEINMFETIIIDRSGSMGYFTEDNSPLREAVKASIIRAKVLEYFKVKFSIIIFDTAMEEIMEFGEKFSDRKKNNIPSRLMRAIAKSGGTDIWKPLTYTLESMKKYAHKNWLKSFGNISFLWDWSPTDWLKDNWLKALISQIRKSWFWLTAYYVNGSAQNIDWLQEYFWTEQSWWTVIVGNVSELTDKLIGSYNENLKKVIKKYTK
ncbi:MAG: hypothetical protein ACD_49C00009G0039 [uncultured bacterium (gcode 4)]|uniref:Transglutaminase-like domain-containing protein n=1 Tax=uncultured bacterium (gcode 4) TaxID=1234023 RepID=K2BX80_9BACT|nr:MAG: hypothetical protein ACD_49C00009G0039 [uncultured bacterium (gcode 4)]